jgi:hypothetical protein
MQAESPNPNRYNLHHRPLTRQQSEFKAFFASSALNHTQVL